MYRQQVARAWQWLIHKEFGRFLVVGGLNTAFGYTLYFIFNFFVHYQIAYAIAYAGGLCFSYWFNARWVFKEPVSWRTFFAYPVVYVFQYGLNVLMLHILVETFGISEWLSPLLVIVASIPITFVMARLVIRL